MGGTNSYSPACAARLLCQEWSRPEFPGCWASEFLTLETTAMSDHTFANGFGPQLLEPELPSRSWDIDRLAKYAQRQHEAIVSREKTLAPYYWRLAAC